MLHGNTLFIAQAYDPLDTNLAGVLDWVKEFSRHSIGEVCVLAQRVKNLDEKHPINVQVFGHGRHLKTMLTFYLKVYSLHRRYNFKRVFIYMGGLHVLLLFPLKLIFGFSLYQWKAHPKINFLLNFTSRYVVDRIYTSTPSALPIDTPKRLAVGTGVSSSKFYSMCYGKKKWDFIFAGRLSPSKNLNRCIDVIDRLRKDREIIAYFLIVGEAYIPEDMHYVDELKNRIINNGLERQIVFHGPAKHDSLASLYANARYYLNLTDTAVDRSVIEAMHCGIPPIFTNHCFYELVGKYLPLVLSAPNYKDETLLDVIEECLKQNDLDYKKTSEYVESYAKVSLSLIEVIKKICNDINEIENCY
jgi:glycosyltransferase involved in cell wall biosynthesis